ncbi:hypothetical protein [Acidithiobacillus sp.]
MQINLAGETARVAGATGDIGRTIAWKTAFAGAAVAINALPQETA